MTPTELQTALLAHMSEQGITRQQIISGEIDNIYPIGKIYLWYLTKGIIKGIHTQLVMADFFNKLNEKQQ
jgi:hypothetical protein